MVCVRNGFTVNCIRILIRRFAAGTFGFVQCSDGDPCSVMSLPLVDPHSDGYGYLR